jgi:hypothetical protein
MEEIAGGYGKLHIEEFHILHYFPSMMKNGERE